YAGAAAVQRGARANHCRRPDRSSAASRAAVGIRRDRIQTGPRSSPGARHRLPSHDREPDLNTRTQTHQTRHEPQARAAKVRAVPTRGPYAPARTTRPKDHTRARATKAPTLPAGEVTVPD